MRERRGGARHDAVIAVAMIEAEPRPASRKDDDSGREKDDGDSARISLPREQHGQGNGQPVDAQQRDEPVVFELAIEDREGESRDAERQVGGDAECAVAPSDQDRPRACQP